LFRTYNAADRKISIIGILEIDATHAAPSTFGVVSALRRINADVIPISVATSIIAKIANNAVIRPMPSGPEMSASRRNLALAAPRSINCERTLQALESFANN